MLKRIEEIVQRDPKSWPLWLELREAAQTGSEELPTLRAKFLVSEEARKLAVCYLEESNQRIKAKKPDSTQDFWPTTLDLDWLQASQEPWSSWEVQSKGKTRNLHKGGPNNTVGLTIFGLVLAAQHTRAPGSFGFEPGFDRFSALKRAKKAKKRFAAVLDVVKAFETLDLNYVELNLSKAETKLLKLLTLDHQGKGLPVGHPTSPMLLNEALSPIHAFVRELVPEATITTFADDILVQAHSKEVLEAAQGAVKLFLAKLGLRTKTQNPVSGHVQWLGWCFELEPRFKLVPNWPKLEANLQTVNETDPTAWATAVARVATNWRNQQHLVGLTKVDHKLKKTLNRWVHHFIHGTRQFKSRELVLERLEALVFPLPKPGQPQQPDSETANQEPQNPGSLTRRQLKSRFRVKLLKEDGVKPHKIYLDTEDGKPPSMTISPSHQIQTPATAQNLALVGWYSPCSGTKLIFGAPKHTHLTWSTHWHNVAQTKLVAEGQADVSHLKFQLLRLAVARALRELGWVEPGQNPREASAKPVGTGTKPVRPSVTSTKPVRPSVQRALARLQASRAQRRARRAEKLRTAPVSTRCDFVGKLVPVTFPNGSTWRLAVPICLLRPKSGQNRKKSGQNQKKPG